MAHIDPIETARRILAGEPLNEEENVELVEDSLEVEDDIVEDDIVEDEDDEDEEDEEEDEDYKKKMKKVDEEDDEEDEDEDEDEDDEDEEDEVKESELRRLRITKILDELKAKETPTLDTSSEEDPKLYQDAEGGHAKIDTDKGTEGKVNKNKSGIKGKAKGKKDPKSVIPAKEHIEVLFAGEDLSEEFQEKATVIFEAAINERVEAIQEEMENDYAAIVVEEIESRTNEMSEHLDDYLGYVVEEWMKENELQVENGIRADVAENFMVGLKELFEKNYVDIPDEKYDVLEALVDTVNELEEKLEQEVNNNINLRKENLDVRCEEVFLECADGLVDTQEEKLRTLAEGLEFEDADQYREKLNILKESYFSNTSSSDFEFEGEEDTTQEVSSTMRAYMTSLGRSMKTSKDNTLS